MFVFPFPFFPVLPSPYPVVGESPGAVNPWSPASSADPQILPGPHLLPTPPLPGATPQGPVPQPYRAFTVSCCCFLLHWKRARTMFLAVSTLSQPAETTVSTETWPPGRACQSVLQIQHQLALSLPLPPRSPPPTGTGLGSKFFLTFLDSF